MSLPSCRFCGHELDRRAPDVYVEQSGWSVIRSQGGSNQLSLRAETGRVAHGACVRLAIRGIDVSTQGKLVE